MIYIVHIYREIKLRFDGVEADTPEAAAAIARDGLTEDADDIDDCDGEDFAALVDVAGDEEFEQSRTIDFEPERQRKASPKLLAALQGMIEIFVDSDQLADFEDMETVKVARAAIAEAESAGIVPATTGIDIHALLAQRRQIAVIWSIEDVQGIRPDLSDDQCWEVLEHVDHHKDAELGITWLTLEMASEILFGDAPKTAEPQGGGHEPR
jgi:hypothetical protein